MTTDLQTAPDTARPPLETPNVMVVTVTYAHAHLGELLRFAEDGGWCLIRDDKKLRRQYWLTGQAPPWWPAMDDTALAERVLSERARERYQPGVTFGKKDGQVHD